MTNIYLQNSISEQDSYKKSYESMTLTDIQKDS